MKKALKLALPALAVCTLCGCTSPDVSEQQFDGYNLIIQKGGQNLGYSPTSGIQILEQDGFKFKDLNKNGKLDVYEDWRKTFEERAEDLAKQLSIEEIGGLMLYSAHQSLASSGFSYGAVGTYDGKPLKESNAKISDLTDQQKKFLKEDHLRHVLITMVESPEVAATWNNNMQAFCEGLDHGIPSNTSTDPRHDAVATAEFNAGAGGQISLWPSTLGLAATFDPAMIEEFGRVASLEYRALGITTALSPQVDIATDPRWWRNSGTFGEDPALSTDIARAYCDGFQTSSEDAEIADGWGSESVNAMVKHWPGGGSGEGGRDAHFINGKYAVYPGHNEALALKPFTEGAFRLNGKTQMASAIMPYYTISTNYDGTGNMEGNNYSKYLITDLLRNKYEFEGVVCTDWGVTADEGTDFESMMGGKCWGHETEDIVTRHYKILMAGVDQFGGNNELQPVLDAYQMGVKEHGEEFMRARMEASAKRLLLNIFRVGLFENPYVNPKASQELVGNPIFMKEGYDAQVKSVVMLKNKNNVLPMAKKKKVYVPKVHHEATVNFFGTPVEAYDADPVEKEQLAKYFTVVDNPSEADFAICYITNPATGNGYSKADKKKGGNGYVPISLQYNDYTAINARPHSLAGGDPQENFTDRSYRGKSTKANNKCELDMVLDTRKAMGEKPVIVCINMDRPMVMAEFEPYVDAILVGFVIQNQVLLDLISGKEEPSALLPMQMPLNMATVEEQFEDTPHDMKCYVDSEGNTYDFAYGLNWKGVINDERVAKYKVKK